MSFTIIVFNLIKTYSYFSPSIYFWIFKMTLKQCFSRIHFHVNIFDKKIFKIKIHIYLTIFFKVFLFTYLFGLWYNKNILLMSNYYKRIFQQRWWSKAVGQKWVGFRWSPKVMVGGWLAVVTHIWWSEVGQRQSHGGGGRRCLVAVTRSGGKVSWRQSREIMARVSHIN